MIRASPDASLRTLARAPRSGGRDNRDHEALAVEIRLDGQLVPAADVTWSRAGGAGKWKARLRKLSEGAHFLEARVEDRARNQTRLQRTLQVLDFGSRPPADSLNPPTFAIQVDDDTQATRPETSVRVTFSEPVWGISDTSLLLERKESDGTWSPVTARRISNQGPLPLTGAQRIYSVYLVPAARLQAGATYRVRGTAEIQDFDDPPKALVPGSATFKVATWKDLGAYPIPDGPVQRVAVLGGRTFVATQNQLYLLRVGGATRNTTPIAFGLTGAGGDFLGQSIEEMKVFRQVPMGCGTSDLLMVTTMARFDSGRQCALWVFNACSQLEVPQLLFGVSLGDGSSGYAPELDCRGGLITVGRLAASILVISAEKAWRGWNSPEQRGLGLYSVIEPGGRNTQAIVQAVYLGNPEGPNLLTHQGVAMLPPAKDAAGGLLPGLPIAVGFPTGGFLRAGKTLRGMPNVILNTDGNGALRTEPPYLPLNGSTSPGPFEPDARAWPGPYPCGNAVSRVAVVANLNTQDSAGRRTLMNLALGPSICLSGFGGGSLVLMNENDPKAPEFVKTWPREPLGRDTQGQPLAYELPRAAPSVDPITSLVAVPVKFTASGEIAWYVLDLATPESPVTVAKVKAGSWFGSFHNGILATGGATRLVNGVRSSSIALKRILDGAEGVDEGQCELLLNRKTVVLSEAGRNWEAPESGFRLGDLEVKLDSGIRRKLQDEDKLIVRFVGQPGAPAVGPIPARAIDPELVVWQLQLTLTGVEQGSHKLQVWGSDRARNPFTTVSWSDHWQGKPLDVDLFFAGEDP